MAKINTYLSYSNIANVDMCGNYSTLVASAHSDIWSGNFSQPMQEHIK